MLSNSISTSVRRSVWSSARSFSSLPLKISEEVQQALNDKKPIVSLESTIITHGLPYPDNVKMASDVEQVIRDNGCVPATMAFIKGEPRVGLVSKDLEFLAEEKNVHKTSRRDIPYVMASKINGGTTISSTMILSKLAGISVFATGGLGGVHKYGENTMDISADLDELSKTEVMVVCSGPKAILDIDRTIEYLETKGVPVLTYNPKQKSKVYVPGFYCEDSNTISPFAFSDFQFPASVFHNGSQMQLGNGYAVCIPPPDHLALEKDFIYQVIDEAQAEAERLGVKGKEVTPFLLGKINSETGGKSVRSNVGFVLNNAKCAAEIAKNINSLQYKDINSTKANATSTTSGSFQPSTKLDKASFVQNQNPTAKDRSEAVVIGSVAVDTTCIFRKGFKMNDSSPGDTKQSVGGVGYNSTLATHYSSRTHFPTENVRLISTIGSDVQGDKILADLEAKEMDTSGLFRDRDSNTAQYISMHGDDGSLIVACADMDIVEKLPLSHVEAQLKRAQPKFVLMDSNIAPQVMEAVIKMSLKLGFQILLEPTSVIKAAKIAKNDAIEVWPNNQVLMATPTVEELDTMYNAFENKFEDIDNWFSLLDKLGLNSNFRNELDLRIQKSQNKELNRLVQIGVFQQSFKILPYIPLLVIKDGKNGIIVIQLVDNANELKRNNSSNASFSVFSRDGKKFTDEMNNQKQLGVLVQHYPIPETIVESDIKNVTGAGDSLMGYLFKRLIIDESIFNPLDIEKRDRIFANCQTAAALSLKSDDAINIKAIVDIE